MKKIFILSIFAFCIISCAEDKIEVSTAWTGLSTKGEAAVEKVFRTTGEGTADITWWAGGYTYESGYFEIRLIDLKTNKEILKKIYRYGDLNTGNRDNPRFHWWHSEEKDKIRMQADRAYKMKLWGRNLGEPGIGWGLWLHKFGETPE